MTLYRLKSKGIDIKEVRKEVPDRISGETYLAPWPQRTRFRNSGKRPCRGWKKLPEIRGHPIHKEGYRWQQIAALAGSGKRLATPPLSANAENTRPGQGPWTPCPIPPISTSSGRAQPPPTGAANGRRRAGPPPRSFRSSLSHAGKKYPAPTGRIPPPDSETPCFLFEGCCWRFCRSWRRRGSTIRPKPPAQGDRWKGGGPSQCVQRSRG